MSNTKRVKIEKVILGVTNNGTPRAYVWQEGADTNSMVEAIDVIGDQALYVATRHKGEEIDLILGKFINVKVPQEFIEASGKPTYSRVIELFKRAINSIDYVLSGNKPTIDMDTTKELIEQEVKTVLELQDTVYKTIKESKSQLAKEIVENMSKPQSEQTLNPYEYIYNMTKGSFNNVNKEYRIDN